MRFFGKKSGRAATRRDATNAGIEPTTGGERGSDSRFAYRGRGASAKAFWFRRRASVINFPKPTTANANATRAVPARAFGVRDRSEDERFDRMLSIRSGLSVDGFHE